VTTISTNTEELAGLWIGTLVINDLDIEKTRTQLDIQLAEKDEQIWNPAGILKEYLVEFKGNVLSLTLDPKLTTKINVKKNYVVLLLGPKSILLAQFNDLNFLKGVKGACKLANGAASNYQEVIARIVNWTTGQVLHSER